MRNRILLGASATFLLCCLSAVQINAQGATSATITGQIVDPQGAVIANAKVTATNVATGIGHSANTTSSGNYTIPNLPPGTSEVKVEQAKLAVGGSKATTHNLGV